MLFTFLMLSIYIFSIMSFLLSRASPSLLPLIDLMGLEPGARAPPPPGGKTTWKKMGLGFRSKGYMLGLLASFQNPITDAFERRAQMSHL